MADPIILYPANKTKDFFYKIILIAYVFCLPNFWIEDLNLSKTFMKIYDRLIKIVNAIIYVFILLEVAAFFTQDNLTEKQMSNLLVYGIAQPVLQSYKVIMAYHKDLAKDVLFHLIIKMKNVYNDKDVERQMIKKSLFYTRALVLISVATMTLCTFDEVMEVVRNDGTFNVAIAAWPDVQDRTTLANVARVCYCIIWWILICSVLAVYIFVISLITCLSHQYKNLQSYFQSLSDIFEKENSLSQQKKEEKYEEAFKVGIKLHIDTLRCTEHSDTICKAVFSGQIMFNIMLLVVLMAQMANSERNLANMGSVALNVSCVLISTGAFMWNAGDITVEASFIAPAMYFSGWQHCRGLSSIRIRNLVVIAMSNAQQPIVLKGFGIIDISYPSYVSIVKSSYSVFSVLY